MYILLMYHNNAVIYTHTNSLLCASSSQGIYVTFYYSRNLLAWKLQTAWSQFSNCSYIVSCKNCNPSVYTKRNKTKLHRTQEVTYNAEIENPSFNADTSRCYFCNQVVVQVHYCIKCITSIDYEWWQNLVPRPKGIGVGLLEFVRLFRLSRISMSSVCSYFIT